MDFKQNQIIVKNQQDHLLVPHMKWPILSHLLSNFFYVRNPINTIFLLAYVALSPFLNS